jgi:glutathione synthase/RimK-type ligase-like ATP-grasp enzyme
MSTLIYSYNPHSQGAIALSSALGIRRIRHEGSRYRGRINDRIINWGSSRALDFGPAAIINKPESVAQAGNKLSFFNLQHTARLPRFGVTREWAANEIRNGGVVVCRTSLTGHSGHGIIIAESEHQLVEAPLYTAYIKKHSEFRVHVVNGHVVDVQRKIRDPDREPSNWRVRSHQNGFIYVRTGFTVPEDVTEQATLGFGVSGLDFGAVDVIWNDHEKHAYVLEINTAPGLTGQTIEHYARAFREHFRVG